jgi:glyoxylase-like metal-dependent hydrolase (beta-lactamase superfamily II)
VDWRVGAVEIARVEDCVFSDLVAQRWLPQFDREAVRAHEHWLAPDHFDPRSGCLILPVHSFLLRTPHHIILIDTCVGNHKERPGVAKMHRLETHYLERLLALGIRPEDVDYVMCTHLHSDHIGWNTRLIDGRWVPTFPRARYILSADELEATQAEIAGTGTSEANRNRYADSILPILAAGQVELIDGGHEMLDLFTFTPAPGHTSGNLRIELRSGGETAILAGDVVHSPIQIPFWHWSTRVCVDPLQAAESRRTLLEDCAATNAVLMPGHFSAPHVGRIRERAGAFSIDFAH